jgi:YidC/Oxa1 family membrane protein insertase
LLDQINISNAKNTQPTILVAPSWFAGCIFDTCIEELIQQLAKLPYNIIIRSHPEFEKRNEKKFRAVKKMIANHPNMSIDTQPDVIARLASTDILITDRSGIAFEFAFAIGKPVLFVETALKQTNPDWQQLGIEPIENTFRQALGISILPTQLNQLEEKIKAIELEAKEFKMKMDTLKPSLFYNSEESYNEGLQFVIKCIRKN